MIMNVLIIEDELPARAKLIQMLKESKDEIHIVATLGSVKDSISWFQSNKSPDLVFVDIQLSDDHSFEIFRQVNVECPIIFTTAYDKYLLESFEYNSIDYLLKPITGEKLHRSLEKVRTLKNHFSRVSQIVGGIPNGVRIIGKKGTEYMAFEPEQVAYFYTEHKVVFARDLEGKNYIVDYTLGELESMLANHRYFRINRKFLVREKSIARFRPDNGKIQIHLAPTMKEEIYVSKENAPTFRKWIGGSTQ